MELVVDQEWVSQIKASYVPVQVSLGGAVQGLNTNISWCLLVCTTGLHCVPGCDDADTTLHQQHALVDAMVSNQWSRLWDAVYMRLALAALPSNVCGQSSAEHRNGHEERPRLRCATNQGPELIIHPTSMTLRYPCQ